MFDISGRTLADWSGKKVLGIPSWQIGNTHAQLEGEAEFLDKSWDKSLRSFSPCNSQSPLLTDFATPPPPTPRAKVA
jgi:hypothetical protein